MGSGIGIMTSLLAGLLATSSPAVARDLEAPVEDRVLHLSVELPVEPAQAFAWFVEPAKLEGWLTEHAEVEPRVGGRYELFWTPATRADNSTIGCHITAFVPSELLAFQWRGPVMWKPVTNGADPLTHVVVSFTRTARGTRVHLVHSGWRSGPDWTAAYEWQEKAWQGAFAGLAPLVRAGQAPRAHEP